MSRIGKLPIRIPGGVEVAEQDRTVRIKGPKGALELVLRPEVDVEIDGEELRVKGIDRGEPRETAAYHGMTRALLNSMVTGVSTGYSKALEIVGVGWNAQAQGDKLTLNVGFSHPVVVEAPQGLEIETPKPMSIVVRGADKQAVGQLAAKIRGIRPPEPYKGKGIRYEGEFVRRKAGKSFGS